MVNLKSADKPSEAELVKRQVVLRTLTNLKEQNTPQRKYIRKDLDKITNREMKIQSTLLEYGQQNVLLNSITNQQASTKQANQDQQTKQNTSNAEEINLKNLINEMSATDQKQNKLNANAVGQILGLQQSALQQIVNEFANKVRVFFF